jgi:hypothetical protein
MSKSSTNMNAATHRSSHPFAVQIALLLLLAVISTSLVRSALRADWSSPFIYIKYVIELTMLGVPMWFAFRRKNWARWLLVAYGVGGFCVSLPRVIQHFNANTTSWLVTYALVNTVVVAALVALFLPSASEWFRADPTTS